MPEIDSWQSFHSAVTELDDTCLLEEAASFVGVPMIGFAVGCGGVEEIAELHNPLRNNLNSQRKIYVVLVTSFRFLSQGYNQAEVRAWFSTMRDELDGNSLSGMIHDTLEYEVRDALDAALTRLIEFAENELLSSISA
jgi:hypothetical protein